MLVMAARSSMRLGVVLERRDLDNPWQDHEWRPVAVIPGAADCPEWRLLHERKGWRRYHAGTLDLELFARETEGYKYNLSTGEPRIFVVVRPADEDDENDVEPFLVTACPYESQDYLDSGEEIVEGVPMPGELAEWINAFVERHHMDEPFVKRKRKKHKDAERHHPFGEEGRRG